MDVTTATVHVVDDEPAVRDGLKFLLESVGRSVRCYGDAASFLTEYTAGAPGCLVLDVRLPDVSGLELQDMLAARGIHLPVIVITGKGDVTMAVRAMKGGAVDFLEKPFNEQVFLERVEQCIRLDASRTTVRDHHSDAERLVALLTPREAQVVRMVTDGMANKQIARQLDISQKTVELHRSKAMRKLKAHHVSEMIQISLTAKSGRP
jgi:two-component system response regulator FixJ